MTDPTTAAAVDYPAPWVEAVARTLHHRIAAAGMPHQPADVQDRHADNDWHGRIHPPRTEADRDLFRAEARKVLAALNAVGALTPEANR